MSGAKIIPSGTTVITGLQEVVHDNTLSGSGTISNPLSVVSNFQIPILKFTSQNRQWQINDDTFSESPEMQIALLNPEAFHSVILILERNKGRGKWCTVGQAATTSKAHYKKSGYCEPKSTGLHGKNYTTRYNISPDNPLVHINFNQFVKAVTLFLNNFYRICFYRDGDYRNYIKFRFRVEFTINNKTYNMITNSFKLKKQMGIRNELPFVQYLTIIWD
jgi:hypothetical protein